MKNIYEPMEDFGGKVYDFDVELTDCWYTGLDDLESRGGFAREFGRCSETLITGIDAIPSATCQFTTSVINSFEIKVGGGFGFGLEAEIGPSKLSAELSAIVAPIRGEYVLNTVDCKNNMTSKYSAGVSIFDYGVEFESLTSAYNDGSGWVYNMPNRKKETTASIGYNPGNEVSSRGGNYSNGDFTLDTGVAAYLFVGADVSISFNLSNFLRGIGICE